MEEKNTRPEAKRTHKRNQRTKIVWFLFVLAFFITGIGFLLGILFQGDVRAQLK